MAEAALTALRPMTEAERAAFRASFIAAWAADLGVLEDLDEPAALALATARTDADLATPGHRLYTIVAGERAVGSLWLSIGAHGQAFLEEVTVDVAARGCGHGRRAMILAEEVARAAGAQRLDLNVYEHNPRALALYDRLGYTTIKRTMRKLL